MAATYEEVTVLRNRMIEAHGIETVELASMLLFFWHSTGQWGAARDMNFPLLSRCAHAYMREAGIALHDLNAAIEDMDKANATLTYLAGMPD